MTKALGGRGQLREFVERRAFFPFFFFRSEFRICFLFFSLDFLKSARKKRNTRGFALCILSRVDPAARERACR